MRRRLRRNEALIAKGDTTDELKRATNPASSPRRVNDE
jgi:hypothetical protein